MSAAPKLCILCGKPRRPHATKYCPECRLKAIKAQTREREKRKKARRKMQRYAAIPEEEAHKYTVDCEGCFYWRQMGYSGRACHYGIDTPHCRGIDPKDCYKHEGTPYRPKEG